MVIDRPTDARAFDQVTLGMGKPLAVVKAQVHAGGRGKAGFVKLVKTRAEAEQAAQFMLTNRMVSVQTGPEGLAVRTARRLRRGHRPRAPTSRSRPTVRPGATSSRPRGRVDIETVAHERPEAILKQALHPTFGPQPFAARKVALRGRASGARVAGLVADRRRAGQTLREQDCSLAEINLLVLTPPSDKRPDGQVVAVDAKFNFDDNGLFRHPELEAMADATEENPHEVRAYQAGLSYIARREYRLPVNARGLRWPPWTSSNCTADSRRTSLDVGGSASEAAVTEAFRIISPTTPSRALVNIFGGS